MKWNCIMEVRAGQLDSTMAQAMAHNVKTAMGDIEMFRELLVAKGDTAELASLDLVEKEITKAYAGLLGMFGRYVSSEIDTGVIHKHEDYHGKERTLVQQAHHDASLARKFMTR